MVNFIDEMLREAEEKELQHKLEFDLLKADSALAAISRIENEMAGVNALADEEVKLIVTCPQLLCQC